MRHLTAVDPISGETLWNRQDLPPGCTLFGDDQYVFALPVDSDEARVFRASDGESAGTRKVPRQSFRQRINNGEETTMFARFEETCLATLGRNLLLWRIERNRRALKLFDPLDGRDVWKERKFAASARACVVADRVVGIFEPSGHFTLIALADGRTIADVKLNAEPSLMDVSLIESGDQYFLLTSASNVQSNMPAMQPMPGAGFSHKPVYRGRLYAFDRQGKLQWPAPAEIKNQFFLMHQPAPSDRHVRLPTVRAESRTNTIQGVGAVHRQADGTNGISRGIEQSGVDVPHCGQRQEEDD